MMIAAFTAVVALGPALRMGSPGPDGTAFVLALDSKGRIAARIACLRNEWVNPEDSAATLMASTIVAATVLATNGSLTEIEDLGPTNHVCVIVPLETKHKKP